MEEVTIIIPVKDEEDGLQYLFDDFQNSNLEKDFEISFIFVIDERTSDNSREIALSFSDMIVNQQGTHGKGAAVRQAIGLWKENITPKIVFLDADGSYSFQSVRKIIEALDGGSDIVSGSRFLLRRGIPNGMSKLHFFGNRFLSMASSARNRRKISDLCTGLWGFTSDSLEQIEFKSNGFDLEAELAGISRKKKLLHSEIPVDWSQRKGGFSKLRSLTDGSRIFLRIIMT